MSKWAQMTTALNAVIAMTDTTVNWGLKFFADCERGCSVTAPPEVPVGHGQRGRDRHRDHAHEPGRSTPTATAVTAAVTYVRT